MHCLFLTKKQYDCKEKAIAFMWYLTLCDLKFVKPPFGIELVDEVHKVTSFAMLLDF